MLTLYRLRSNQLSSVLKPVANLRLSSDRTQFRQIVKTVRFRDLNQITRVIFEPASAVISYKGEVGEGSFVPRVEGDALEYGWSDIMPCDGIKPSRKIKFILEDDEPPMEFPTKQMSEIIIRCVVMEPASNLEGLTSYLTGVALATWTAIPRCSL